MSQPKKLYKCISSVEDYRYYILKEKQIRFARVDELPGRNDEMEFNRLWDSDSWVFNLLRKDFEDGYNRHFRNTAVLCLNKTPNRECWDEYCKQGGIRYEFSYDSSHIDSSGVYSGHVIYDNNKEHNSNLFLYLYEKELLPRIKFLLKQKTFPGREEDRKKINAWINNEKIKKKILDHLMKEMVFKKVEHFAFEDEYRFVHLLNETLGTSLKVKLIEQKLDYEKIGLKLEKISTDDVSKVKKELGQVDIEVGEVYFSNDP